MFSQLFDCGYDPYDTVSNYQQTSPQGDKVPINPNSAFTRVYFDLATPVALQLEEVVKVSGKTKKQLLNDVITEYVKTASSAKQTKGKK